MREGRRDRLTLSVALATFNGGRFLSRQLETLLMQTVLPDEIVISDDGSADGTRAIIADFRAPDTVRVVKLLNTDRLGYADNFLRAALRCSGDYIAFCDQDDEWHPTKIERTRDALAAERVDLLVHDAVTIDDQGRRIGTHSHGLRNGLYDAGELPLWGVFFGFTCVVERRLLFAMPASARPQDDIDPQTRLSHDRWIYFLANSFGRTRLTSDRLVSYRQHASNAFGSKHTSLWRKVGKLLTGYRGYLAKYEALARNRVSALRAAQGLAEDQAKFYRPIRMWEREARMFRLRQEMLKGATMRKRAAAAREVLKGGYYGSGQVKGGGKQAVAMDIAGFLLRL